MARQHDSLGNEAAERLLRKKLDLLKGGERSRTSSALDLLTGNTSASTHDPAPRVPTVPPPPAPVAVAAPFALIPEPLPAPAPPPARTSPTGERREMRRRTVYLSDQDLERIERIMQSAAPAAAGGSSRSAVVRQAISQLFAATQGEAQQTEESA